jgi:uncharacterized phage protein (TIGR01671 family)
MREIKFRVWDGTTKHMHRPDVPDDQNKFHIFLRGNFSYMETYMGSDCILLQYTGLLDKNGKEIYEGDLIEIVYERRDSNEETLETKTFIREVIFKDGAFVLKPDFTEGFNSRNSSLTTAKIIGNIYENPDLLKS